MSGMTMIEMNWLLQFGFFERKRPEHDDMENEPLKSENGHWQRDEAL